MRFNLEERSLHLDCLTCICENVPEPNSSNDRERKHFGFTFAEFLDAVAELIEVGNLEINCFVSARSTA